MKTSWKILLLANAAILIILGGVLFVLMSSDARNTYIATGEWTLTIQTPDSTEYTWKMENISVFPYIEQYYFLYRGEKGEEMGTFRGVSLIYLISEVVNVTTFTSVLIQAIDGYGSSLDFNEVNSTEEIIIAYMKDGNSLLGPREGGEGPLRLVIPQRYEGDFNALRCVKYVNKIVIN